MGLQHEATDRPERPEGRRASADGVTRPRGTRTRAMVALGTAGLVLVVAGCTGSSSKEAPTPDDAPIQALADQLASSLQGGSVDGVPLVGTDPADATAERRAVFAAVPVRPAITVADVERDPDHEDEATATLRWSWPLLADRAWTYSTTVHLEQGTAGATATRTAAPAVTSSAAPSSGGSSGGPHEADLDGWAVRWDPGVLLDGLADGERVTVEALAAQRGEILDASGHAIVENRAVHVVGVDKTLVGAAGARAAARSLAARLDLDPAAYAKQVADAGDKAFVAALTLRADDPTDVDALAAIRGVRVVDSTMALAPTHDWARPLLGTVGPATADIVKASDGRVQAGDTTGISGIEKEYDAQLSGTPGVVVRLVDADGVSVDTSAETADPTDGPADEASSAPTDGGTDAAAGATEGELFRVDAADGTPVSLTLDSALQTDAEQILEGQKVPAAIVAVDAKGNVLAAASATAGGGLSTATTGRYAPGSTFKLASSLALLRTGATPSSTLTCEPSTTQSGKSFRNDPDYPSSGLGKISLRTAFAYSCNTAFVSQAAKIDQPALAAAAADLGIGVPSDLGVPAFFGSVPADSTGTDHAASLMGQGRVEASPLTMATVAASVAAGHRVSPVLVDPKSSSAPATAAPDPSSTSSSTASGTASSTAPAAAPSKLTATEAKTLRSLMRSVVTDGTGTVLEPLGGDVAAKTGTAQYGDGSHVHAWMIATTGDVGVCVFVEDGSYGATTAGPLLKTFLQDLARDRTAT
ncbi:penicillin-binding transpeptidase domain-containing protein [Luteimicrobium subarcticum]|uniref:Beta-lactamase n=1 Tax=Luteimicrobium subarcticum TaxID=620910 RepID=A0A2M8WTN9_9MICO|nr:penicillin-binding transpeptidase domain-containing protein [Luteimicrobium subarcticum]PJI94300.1 cell division protein FtsI/penicillin-binding protein 2 [Luteimicrobium subarcticum]